MRQLGTILIAWGICGWAASAQADEWLPHWYRCTCPSDRMERAGYPLCVAPWAQCSREKNAAGYYVGGGAARKGEGRYCHEGTWGLDYIPKFTNVRLGWFHGRRYQGGEGQYEPDQKNNPAEPFLNP